MDKGHDLEFLRTAFRTEADSMGRLVAIADTHKAIVVMDSRGRGIRRKNHARREDSCCCTAGVKGSRRIEGHKALGCTCRNLCRDGRGGSADFHDLSNVRGSGLPAPAF